MIPDAWGCKLKTAEAIDEKRWQYELFSRAPVEFLHDVMELCSGTNPVTG